MIQLLTPDEAAEVLRVPRSTLTYWRYTGRGPAFVRCGRLIRYRADQLTDFIERSSETSGR